MARTEGATAMTREEEVTAFNLSTLGYSNRAIGDLMARSDKTVKAAVERATAYKLAMQVKMGKKLDDSVWEIDALDHDEIKALATWLTEGDKAGHFDAVVKLAKVDSLM